MDRRRSLLILALWLAAPSAATAAALEDIQLEVSHEPCEGMDANDKSVVVYAANLNSTRTIDANFKYDTNPAEQHFICCSTPISIPSRIAFRNFSCVA